MVEVVFQEVVFGEVGDVAGLDGGEERDVGGVGGDGEDVDHLGALIILSFLCDCGFVAGFEIVSWSSGRS